jgi:hypothetical protein
MHAGGEEWIPCSQFGISNKSEPSHPRRDMLSQPATGKYTLWRVGKGIRFVCEKTNKLRRRGLCLSCPSQLAVSSVGGLENSVAFA